MPNVQVEITEADQAALKACLDHAVDVNKIARIIARVGAREALDQATGKSVPTTMADLRVSRVRALLLEGVDVQDAEGIVATLFKIPIASARRIIDTAVARFDVELNSSIEKSAKVALENYARWQDNEWKVAIPSTVVRKWLQNEISAANLSVIKQSERGSVWAFQDRTYQRLRERVGLAERPHP